MGLAINLRVLERINSLRELQGMLMSADGSVPLLALRLPEFERIAWRRGKPAAQKLERQVARAFYAAAQSLLRREDLLGHDRTSDVFAALLLAPSRQERDPCALDCRSTLERLASAISGATGLIVQTGWSILRKTNPSVSLDHEIGLAFERGARERERFEFFATVGHELRTPLSSIRGYLETLLDDELDPQMSRRFLEIARREALRLGRLVDGMFEFSLLDLSSDRLLGARSELPQCILAAVEAVRPLAQTRGIAIQVGESARVSVGLENDACVQALVNVLENASKFGRESGIIEIASLAQEGRVRIVVDDDGPGVGLQDRAAIFGLRIRGSQADRPGTGIGLAIVRMIVERAGGEVSIGQSPLGGARFEIALPKRAELEVGVS